jgi:hypothetical protein
MEGILIFMKMYVCMSYVDLLFGHLLSTSVRAAHHSLVASVLVLAKK